MKNLAVLISICLGAGVSGLVAGGVILPAEAGFYAHGAAGQLSALFVAGVQEPPLPITPVEGGIPQAEPEVTCGEGDEPLEIHYGEHTVGCSISPTTDMDSFEFFGFEGDWIRIAVAGHSWSFDPKAIVFGPDGSELASNSCNAGDYGTCSFALEATLIETGIHTILMTEAHSDDAGDYTLQLERIPPDLGAPTIAYNSTIVDTISPAPDHDFLAFEGVAGSIIRLSVAGQDWNFDPWLRLIDPNGNAVVDQYCNGWDYGSCSFTVPDLTLVTSGTYYLILAEAGHDTSGGYHVTLQCVNGDCPMSPSNLTISPFSGKYVTSERCDLVFVLETPPGVSVTDAESIKFDGVERKSSLWPRLVPGTLVTGGQTYRLHVPWSKIPAGTHFVSATFNLSSGTSVSDNVVWDVLQNTEP